MTTPTDDEDAGMKGNLHHSAHEQAAKLALSNEAAEWFIRLRDDRLGVRHREHNVRWLKQSPAHIAELLRIQQVYKVLRAAKVQNRTPGMMTDDVESNVVAITPRPAASESIESRPRFASVRGSWKIAAAVAGITVSLLLGFMVKVAWLDRTLETELGEWRTVQLTDGTEVRIAPDTELQLAFGDDRRTVQLVRGEAMFHVAKDAARPFFVQSEMIGVLAVGTEFRVLRRGGEDVVAVTEGSVALYRDGREAVRGVVSAPPARVAELTGGVALKAGDQVSVTPDSRSKPVAKEKVNAEYESAWADGWVVYENRSIAEVASEFNRRNRVKIVIADPAIAARRLAFFRGNATDPESLVAALAASPDIAIVRNQPNELRVERKP